MQLQRLTNLNLRQFLNQIKKGKKKTVNIKVGLAACLIWLRPIIQKTFNLAIRQIKLISSSKESQLLLQADEVVWREKKPFKVSPSFDYN